MSRRSVIFRDYEIRGLLDSGRISDFRFRYLDASRVRDFEFLRFDLPMFEVSMHREFGDLRIEVSRFP